MKDKIQETYTQLTKAIADSLNDMKASAKKKSRAFIDDWLQVLPEFEAMGLEITSFGVALAISPALEVEMTGPSSAFTEDRLEELMKQHELNNYVMLVLKTIRTTRKMHKKLGKDEIYESIFIKIRVKVPPEVRVYFGRPVII